MKTYTVHVTETAVYTHTIKAESEEQAKEIAMQAQINAEQPNDFFSHLEDRSASIS